MCRISNIIPSNHTITIDVASSSELAMSELDGRSDLSETDHQQEVEEQEIRSTALPITICVRRF